MARNKTQYTSEDVTAFIETVENEQKREDSYRLLAFMQEVTGESPCMFGASIIGFGRYHYKYASGHEGEAPLLGFSPRKAAISLYVYAGNPEEERLLKDLGKFTMGKACIYIKKLSDINEAVFKQLMQTSIEFICNHYTRL